MKITNERRSRHLALEKVHPAHLLLACVLATPSLGCEALLIAAVAPEPAKQAPEPEKNIPEPQQIKEAKLDLADGATTYCQGGEAPKLRLSITRTSGKKQEFVFDDSDDADRVFKLFTWSASVGAINEEGKLDTTAASPSAAEQDIEVTATLAKASNISTKLTLAPDFKCSRTADLRGEAGKEGDAGKMGSWGDISTRERRRGGNGTNGGNGGPGGNGGDALPVEVVATLIQSDKHGKLALVRVQQVGGPKKAYYLLDPAAAVLTVDASGGAGGRGGHGGQGGSGYQGYGEFTSGECCNGDGGDGGNGGDGGPGGNGGKGAAVTVKIDAKAKELKDRIKVVNGPGPGGEPGHGGSGGDLGAGGNGSQGERGSDGHRGADGRPSTAAGKPGGAGPAPSIKTEAVPKSVAEGK